MLRPFSSIVVPTVSIASVFLLWYLLGQAGVIGGTRAVPTLESCGEAAAAWYQSGTFWIDVRTTLGRVVPGLVIGALLGVMVGLATGRIVLLYQAIGPLFHLVRALPAVALGGFLIMLDIEKTSIVVWGVFFPVWINAHGNTSAECNDLACHPPEKPVITVQISTWASRRRKAGGPSLGSRKTGKTAEKRSSWTISLQTAEVLPRMKE